MNKKEAAERLGVSTRLVERYAGEGRLGEIKYVRGKTGKQADYDEAAVERLKAELEAPAIPTTALQAPNSPRAGLIASEMSERLVSVLEALHSERSVKAEPALSDLAAKPLLTLIEAQRLTGLSRQTLRAAIDTNKLKAKIIGHAWRVKSKDLQAYIDKL